MALVSLLLLGKTSGFAFLLPGHDDDGTVTSDWGCRLQDPGSKEMSQVKRGGKTGDSSKRQKKSIKEGKERTEVTSMTEMIRDEEKSEKSPVAVAVVKEEEEAGQVQESGKDDTTTTSTAASIMDATHLKTVDPFAFIGKSTSQHSDHRTQAVVSGLASLQLEESLRLQELFKATDFAQHFFKHFHPTGALSAFAGESIEERRASSRLMSPVLCSSVLKRAGELKRDLPASVLEALLCSGHVSAYRSDLVDRVLGCVRRKVGGSPLFRALLTAMSDFSDAELVKLIMFILDGGQECFTYAAESDVYLMRLLSMPKSTGLLKTYLMAWSDKMILALLDRIEGFLKRPGCTAHRQVILFDWLAVCIDSQYPLCVMKPEFTAKLASIQEFVQQRLVVDTQLTELAGILKTLTKKDDLMRFLPKADTQCTTYNNNGHYSIEITDL